MLVCANHDAALNLEQPPRGAGTNHSATLPFAAVEDREVASRGISDGRTGVDALLIGGYRVPERPPCGMCGHVEAGPVAPLTTISARTHAELVGGYS